MGDSDWNPSVYESSDLDDEGTENASVKGEMGE